MLKSAVLDALTPRELQVIELVAAGLDNRTIGQRLGISEKTVRNRVSTIFSKIGVNGRPQAIVWARDAGFGGNSTALATDTDASIALANMNFYIGARNSSGTAELFGNDQLAIVTIGGGMTNGANVAQFQADLNAYMTALGTNVY